MRVALIGGALLVATTAGGGIEHTILHGVSVGRVRAWVSGPDQVPGLTQEHLQGLASSTLDKAGIRPSANSEAELFIGATTVLSQSGACFVHLEARLVERATLVRNGHAVDASSWGRVGEAAADSAGGCASLASKVALDLLGDFVEHYTAMNPAPTTR